MRMKPLTHAILLALRFPMSPYEYVMFQMTVAGYPPLLGCYE